MACRSWRWNDAQRHALARHLDRVRVTQLARSEPAPHARLRSGAPQLLAARSSSSAAAREGGQHERLADAKSGAPHADDPPAKA
jgi:hypothetical protein